MFRCNSTGDNGKDYEASPFTPGNYNVMPGSVGNNSTDSSTPLSSPVRRSANMLNGSEHFVAVNNKSSSNMTPTGDCNEAIFDGCIRGDQVIDIESDDDCNDDSFDKDCREGNYRKYCQPP